MDEVDRQIEHLKNPDYRVHQSATEALVKIGTPAIPALTEVLSYSTSYVRYSAMEALGKIGTPAIPSLIMALSYSDDFALHPAVEALVKIGTPAIPALTEALNDGDWYSRQSAAKVLRDIAIKQPSAHLRGAIPTLKRLRRVRSEKANWPVYQRALETIEKATAGLKDTPIAITTTVATAQDLPVPVEEAPTTAPAPLVRKGLLRRLFRRDS